MMPFTPCWTRLSVARRSYTSLAPILRPFCPTKVQKCFWPPTGPESDSEDSPRLAESPRVARRPSHADMVNAPFGRGGFGDEYLVPAGGRIQLFRLCRLPVLASA